MNNKICIISVIKGDYIGGNLIDCLDLYYNLRDYIKCDYFILIQANQLRLFADKLKNTFKQKLYKDIIKHIRPYNYQIDFDKYDLFIYRYNYYQMNPSITQYKGILLNGWSATQELIYYKNNVFTNFIHIVTTPFILQFDKTSNYFMYFHKLSQLRLKNLIYKNKNISFSDYQTYESLKSHENFNIHNYKTLEYNRHKVDDTDFYMEMKGKLIFEFLYFGKQVHYSPVNKCFNDGLTDYLALFGIDDNIEQDLHISKESIFDKLVKFDENDELLQFIKRC